MLIFIGRSLPPHAAASCALEGRSPEYAIVQQYIVCGHERKTAPEDGSDAIIAVAKNA